MAGSDTARADARVAVWSVRNHRGQAGGQAKGSFEAGDVCEIDVAGANDGNDLAGAAGAGGPPRRQVVDFGEVIGRDVLFDNAIAVGEGVVEVGMGRGRGIGRGGGSAHAQG